MPGVSDPDSFDDDFAPSKGAKQRPGLSLKARAVALLSRREHSRAELARKLAPHAQDADDVSRVLDALAAEGWQSDDRYVQGLVHRKAPGHGAARVAQELRQQGIDEGAIAQVRQSLRETELDRAIAVWRKRFGAVGLPSDQAGYARQGRFLASRGFSHDVIHKVLRSLPESDQ